ncbi:putative PRONE domain, Rop guanine nucleotide exchange factor [Helianthus annuus]|uniref:PRONE domain, Rop guanine nucleotide exchange factor n=1 Tax=Helianthus annuus TaxID=4232 RepID=A0A251UNG5_HELAN|nr:rho guanine nucleotide exchange factor 8 [Helianthus annuus]KAF5805311.1 putative PRONE domain, Rop guanine nucleotide exchange factor [Helianthus annuus]KAJ0922188.1 putative PRONE domain, Rop guanine nucleotide exchange factor [Helianthus annuus]
MSDEPGNNRAPGPMALKRPNSEMEQMKERFVRLLLGEDMTGRGQGVSSALALSNAIINLAASVFGKQNKLVPVPEDRKRKWRKEIDWLLSVTDHIVEFVPSQQIGIDGSTMEIMVTQQRRDLLMNIPALKKLNTMLIDCLDNFKDQKEFWYVPEDADESMERWWIPRVKLPPGGLSDESRKWIQHQKDTCNQVLKASMAINAQVLSEMEIPETYIDSLPKNGKTSLGDSIYKSITDEFFDPGQFLSTMDLSSEQNVMDVKNKVEASIVIWKRKMNYKELKSSWSSSISSEKREVFEERAETILLLIKQKFPALAQSALDVSKIEHNKDIGQSILESFSRVLESLTNTVLKLIEDVLKADEVAQNPSLGMIKKNHSMDFMLASPLSILTLGQLIDRSTPVHSPRRTPRLSDSKGWGMDQELIEENGNSSPNLKIKHVKILTKAKMSYMERLEAYGVRSPTARH